MKSAPGMAADDMELPRQMGANFVGSDTNLLSGTSTSKAEAVPDFLFRCNHCIKLIPESAPIYMRHDSSYCSVGCREKGISNLYTNLVGHQLRMLSQKDSSLNSVKSDSSIHSRVSTYSEESTITAGLDLRALPMRLVAKLGRKILSKIVPAVSSTHTGEKILRTYSSGLIWGKEYTRNSSFNFVFQCMPDVDPYFHGSDSESRIRDITSSESIVSTKISPIQYLNSMSNSLHETLSSAMLRGYRSTPKGTPRHDETITPATFASSEEDNLTTIVIQQGGVNFEEDERCEEASEEEERFLCKEENPVENREVVVNNDIKEEATTENREVVLKNDIQEEVTTDSIGGLKTEKNCEVSKDISDSSGGCCVKDNSSNGGCAQDNSSNGGCPQDNSNGSTQESSSSGE